MTDFTPNLRLKLIDFNTTTWHDDAWDNYRIIDAAVAVFGLSVQGLWTNSTAVVVGENYVDAELGTIWQCVVSHTTPAAPTLFADDRTANPGRWAPVTNIGTWRGNWAPATAYAARDIIYETTNKTYYQCNTTHTSSATFPPDIANWDILADFSIVIAEAEAARDAAQLSEANAATSEANAATSETNAANSASAAATSESNAASSAASASSSASAAATSASNAATSETNAAASAASALGSLTTFNGHYLGAQSSDPTLDENGDPLTGGELYFNDVTLVARIYDLGTTTWYDVGQATSPVVNSGTGDGTTTTFNLGAAPISENFVFAYTNGQYVPKSEFSIVGSDIVYTTAPVDGDDLEWVTLTAVDIGTPSDGTVGADQLVNDDAGLAAIRAKLDIGIMDDYYDKLINGNFWLDQRKSGPYTASGYTLDRWKLGISGGAAVSVTQVADYTGGDPLYGLQLARSVAGTASAFITQRIEDVRTLAGKKATIYLKIATTADTEIVLRMWQQFGTGSNSPSPVNAFYISADQAITSGADNVIKLVVDVDDLTGKTIGDSPTRNNSVEVGVEWPHDATNPTATLTLKEFALVEGDASDQDDIFRPRHRAHDKLLAMRYYEKSWPEETAVGSGSASGSTYGNFARNASNQNYTTIRFVVPKRTSPTMTAYGNTGTAGKYLNVSVSVEENANLSGTATSALFNPSTSSNVNLGDVWRLQWTAESEL